MKVHWTCACLLLLALGCGGEGAESNSAPWFTDVLAESGIDFVHSVGPERLWHPESVAGGVGLFDADGDGRLEVYFVQGGDLQGDAEGPERNRLYRNLGGMRFEDVTATAGVGDPSFGMGCACEDYDSDGDVDLYVTNVGRNRLYQNDGRGRFTDVTDAAGVGDPSWSASAAFVDYDADGDLDLFVVNYMNWSIETNLEGVTPSGRKTYASPTNFSRPCPDTLYRNNGDGTFEDVSREAGLREAFGNGLGIECGDMDGDGDIDLYVTNDMMENQLWINQGDGTFVDRALTLGCALSGVGKAEAGMGVHAADLDGDDDLDLLMTHLHGESNTLYRNEGRFFEDATAREGLALASQDPTGFGVGLVDFDHDGRRDQFVANGRVVHFRPVASSEDPFAEPDSLYRRVGASFELLPDTSIEVPALGAGRGAAFGDLDDDGAIDIVVVNRAAVPYLLRNVVRDRGSWVGFRVLEATGRDALLAAVYVQVGDRSLRRRVQRTYSYCASHDPRVHFGLGDATGPVEVRVRWLDGTEEDFGARAVGEYHVLRRGESR